MKKDKLQNYLESVCVAQAWARNQLKKDVVVVDKINRYSIASLKQKLK